jgi:hypothetical protein
MRADELYAFMVKREKIRLLKEQGKPWPWTDDPVLQQYKFTNVKRAHDRTTRWFWENILDKHKDAPQHILLFNCALFRYFGTMEFFDWQPVWNEAKGRATKNRAAYRLSKKERVFTGAYVITNQGIKAPKQDVVVDYFLTPFYEAAPRLCEVARQTRSWRLVAQEMMKLQGFGGTGFMTKEVLQDAMHTSVLSDCTDRNTWCPVGPGARRGLNRVFGRDKDHRQKEEKFLEELLQIFWKADENWPDSWVELELHDIQFQLCEFDKYERVLSGEGRPRSKYRRPV